MSKLTKKKREKPLTIDMDFDGAVERLTVAAPIQPPTAGPEDERVRLVQRSEGHPLLIYSTSRGIAVELPWRDGTLWATQKQMAEMFGVKVPAISKHIKNIFEEGELLRQATVSDMEIVQQEGDRLVTRDLEHYNLNAIISVGYRIESKVGTMFRIWATERLVQILTKGFFIDKEVLKQPGAETRIDEIKRILQDIRSEQASVHRELESICAQCQDYVRGDPKWSKFFRDTSAAIFFAAVQLTPSEVIMARASADRPNMGLVTFPKDRVWKADVTVGKNYLGQIELDDLNRFSSLLLDFILDQAKSGRLVTMAQAQQRIVEMTKMSGRKVLRAGGDVSRKAADAHVHAQYEIYDAKCKAERRIKGDRLFDEADGN